MHMGTIGDIDKLLSFGEHIFIYMPSKSFFYGSGDKLPAKQTKLCVFSIPLEWIGEYMELGLFSQQGDTWKEEKETNKLS